MATDTNMYGMEVDGNENEEEDEEYDYIDINSLPNDQQQYFLQEDNGGSDGAYDTFENQDNVKFNESYAINAYEEGGDDQEIESDYCDDLAEIYAFIGIEEDVIRYKGIHLMDIGGHTNRSRDEDDEQNDKFQCPDTGAHFEYLDMCRRVKKLSTRRVVIDQVLEE